MPPLRFVLLLGSVIAAGGVSLIAGTLVGQSMHLPVVGFALSIAVALILALILRIVLRRQSRERDENSFEA